jgi:hypothetical protein
MGGKKDKKKKAKDPLKKAALAAKKDAKADRAALRRLQKEGAAEDANDDDECDRRRDHAANSGGGDDWDAILESYRSRTRELTTAELTTIDDPFPRPPRANFTWTLCPSNGMFYMVSPKVSVRPDRQRR